MKPSESDATSGVIHLFSRIYQRFVRLNDTSVFADSLLFHFNKVDAGLLYNELQCLTVEQWENDWQTKFHLGKYAIISRQQQIHAPVESNDDL